MSSQTKHWQVIQSGVHILLGVGYRISYNPSTEYTFNHYKSHNINHQLITSGDTKETALYIQKYDCYFVLDGDFRLEFEVCKNLTECLSLFENLAPKHRSKWSMDTLLHFKN